MMLIVESSPLTLSITSVNLELNKSVIYCTFDDLCILLKRIEPYGWIWVIDVVDAYYCIPS